MSDFDSDQEFLSAMAHWQNNAAPAPAVIQRLYHDPQGQPLFYSAQDLPGLFVDLDSVTFMAGSMHVCVKQGKLIRLNPYLQVKKLVPHADHGTCCSPHDVCVIVDPQQLHTKWRRSA